MNRLEKPRTIVFEIQNDQEEMDTILDKTFYPNEFLMDLLKMCGEKSCNVTTRK